MIPLFIYKLRLRANNICCSWSCTIENRSNIKIGNGTVIGRGATLKGSISNNGGLIIGENCRIRGNCYLSATKGSVKIGNYVIIAHNSWLGGRGSIDIGDNTLIGPGVVVISSNHDLTTGIFPAMQAPEIQGAVKVGANSWIGANSTIVPNVSIGSNCIVGGGSVVINDIPNGHLAAGNPASVRRKIEGLSSDLYKESNRQVD